METQLLKMTYQSQFQPLRNQDQLFCELVQYQEVLTHIECDIQNIYKQEAIRSISACIIIAPGTSYFVSELSGLSSQLELRIIPFSCVTLSSSSHMRRKCSCLETF
ncbi:unnamed protein product (macronuclear) [Paramecium tetraurelia]|uniref:Uncharacterized protein n=1 Tax=Paramecium tetraurelia TaxID=5888 RepID=A0DEN8_PARTE|nr:uncharacterized protein GSPATT00016331001 [Paramecium tetraurelia]CAK81505.1 unnamed protein product [Paramecium tetraurelia]|eukprot:XP_001448902.1 hypothetical protein (macronuclear) [Paramecium tetraurelia strain d4-2]